MNDLYIAGYASRFGEADLSGDIVQRGAFSASLLECAHPFPMLFGHQTDTPIGVWDRVVEDPIGLWVEGRILDATSAARRLVETRAVSGLSIGYRTRRSLRRAAGGRVLSEIDLWERCLSSPSQCCALRKSPTLATPLKSTQPLKGDMRDP